MDSSRGCKIISDATSTSPFHESNIKYQARTVARLHSTIVLDPYMLPTSPPYLPLCLPHLLPSFDLD